MNQTWQILSLSTLAIIFTFKLITYLNRPEGNAQIIERNFQTEWHNDGGSIAQWAKIALKENRIKYSSFYIKKNIDDSNEAVVACTNDDKTYQFYKYNYQWKSLEPIEDDGIPKPH